MSRLATTLKLSPSAVWDFFDCQRLYWLRHVRRIEPIVPAYYFVEGRAFDAGITALHTTGSLEAGLRQVKREFASVPKPLSGSDMQAQVYSRVMTEGAIRAYAAQAPYIKGWLCIGSQVWMEHNLAQLDVRVGGYIDMVLKVRNAEWLSETKFASSAQRELRPFSLQTATYLWLAHENSRPVKGLKLNVVEKPGIRLKKTETPIEYCRRLSAWYAASPKEHFSCVDVLATPDMYQWVEATYLSVAKDIARRGSAPQEYMRNDKRCTFPHECEFLPICEGGFRPAAELPSGFRCRPAKGAK